MERTLPPANISPLIKGLRWSFLIAGVLYGASRYNLLLNREKRMVAESEKTRPEREAKIRAEKERLAKNELEELGKQLGSSIK